MEDLAKISEALMKPILYTKNPKKETIYTFYIIDSTPKYQYKTETKPK